MQIQHTVVDCSSYHSIQRFEDFWYAALVQAKCENIVAKQIKAISKILDVWVASGKNVLRKDINSKVASKSVENVLLRSYVFFRFPIGTERGQKYQLMLEIKKLTKVFRIVLSPGHSYGEWEGAHIPDQQIGRVKFLLEMSDKAVGINTKERYVKGEMVRVVRGCLTGLEGVVCRDDDGKDRIYVVIDAIGCASTEISRLDVECIRGKSGGFCKQDAH